MSTLREKSVAGVKWVGAATAVVSILQFVQVAVLTRILGAASFGLVTTITIVIGFARTYVDMGLSGAVIQRQNSSRTQLSSLYWTNLACGVAAYLALVAAAPWVAGFYEEPRLRGLLARGALLFLIVPLGQQYQALLQKEFRFRTLAVVEIAAAVMGAAVAVISAVGGSGIFSLVNGQLAAAGLGTALLVLNGIRTWRPALHFSTDDLRGYLGFGAYQVAEQSVNYFSANADYLVIGKFLGAEALGVYSLAYQLVVIPLQKLNPILTRVAFPVFSTRQDDHAALRRGYGEMVQLLAFVTLPLLAGLAATAPLSVPLLFGPRWGEAVPLVQILALLGAVKALGNPSGPVLLAKGRTDIGFRWNVFVAVSNTVIFLAVVRYGVVTLAWAYATLCVVYYVLALQILRRVIELDARQVLRSLAIPLTASLAMSGVVYAGQSLLLARVGTSGAVLAAMVLLGGVAYVAVWAVLNPLYLHRVRSLLVQPGS